jgi:hypothetical protein
VLPAEETLANLSKNPLGESARLLLLAVNPGGDREVFLGESGVTWESGRE